MSESRDLDSYKMGVYGAGGAAGGELVEAGGTTFAGGIGHAV
jgi:hypothetical protein